MATSVNYRNLWERLRIVYKKYGQQRKIAVLDNFKDKKAHICKKLGVVSDADVNRITDDLRKTGEKNPAR